MVRHPAKRNCIDLAAEGLLQGLFTGASFGMFFALHNRRLNPEPNALRQIRRSFALSIYLFSSLLSLYHGCTCVASHVRGRDDVLNACIGGTVAGLLTSLPTFNRRTMVQNAVAMGCVGGCMDRLQNPPVQAAAAAYRHHSRSGLWQTSGWRQQQMQTVNRFSLSNSRLPATWRSTALQ